MMIWACRPPVLLLILIVSPFLSSFFALRSLLGLAVVAL